MVDLTGVAVVEFAREFGGRRKTRGIAVGDEAAFLLLSETADRVERCLGVFAGDVGAVTGSSASSWASPSSLCLGESVSARPISSFSAAGRVAAARAAPAAIPRPASPTSDRGFSSDMSGGLFLSGRSPKKDCDCGSSA